MSPPAAGLYLARERLKKHSAATESKRGAVVVNPLKSKNVDVRAIMTPLCSDEGWTTPSFVETTTDDPGTGQTNHALAEGADHTIAAGGDGTVRCVAQALVGTSIPLGLIPLGTGNLLARNLGLDINDPATAARDAPTGTDHPIDVIQTSVDHAEEMRLFLVMAGLGFDSAVMVDMNEGPKDTVGWLAYIEAGIRTLPGRPVKATITIDGGLPTAHRLRGAMSGNCGKLQGGVVIFPGARFDDGVLDLMTVAPRGTLGWLGVLAGLVNRGRSEDPSIRYFHGKKAEISLGRPQAIQFDGDPLGDASHLILTIDAGAPLVRTAWP